MNEELAEIETEAHNQELQSNSCGWVGRGSSLVAKEE